ncbi:hypothetical protein AGDE_03407 [Angomonas deanei]|nr:hypothetical protein AGDE_03407 [Angomonas deanei]|eukprot:EPY40521.1 hypothetical protein AGDE_03407 [Angomonas deanei]
MALLQHLKQLANVAFQEGRYEEALTLYQNCLKVTQALGGGDSENVASDQVIRSNVVMTLIKLSQYDDARLVATVLLQDEQYPLAPDLKVKLLYRRGIASKQLGDKSSAISDFKSAIHFSPDQKNPMAEAELNRLTR